MDQILGDLRFCFVYVDDILIFSPDIDTHVQHLRQDFELLRLQGLTDWPPQVCIHHFQTWIPGTQPLQLWVFSIRQAHFRPQFFSSAFRQTCSSEIPV